MSLFGKLALTRTFLAGTVTFMLLLGAACCANNPSSLQRSYERAYGDPARSASQLSTTEYGVALPTCPVTVQVRTIGVNRVATITSAGAELSAAQMVFATADEDSTQLSGLAGELRSNRRAVLSFIEVTLRDGGKWYFDPAGKWFPDGYTPKLSVMVGHGVVTVAAADYVDHVDEVQFFYADGNRTSSGVDSRGQAFFDSTRKLSYMQLQVKYNKSKWYFDSAGIALPNGYTPTVSMIFKNNSVEIVSSDLYSEVKVYFTDGTTQSWSTNAFSGTYRPFQGRTLETVGITLKSNGGKWYFDSAGAILPSSSKWYTDAD